MYNFKQKDGNKEILGVCVLFGVITLTLTLINAYFMDAP